MTLTHFAIIAVCAYLLGSLSFAIIVSKVAFASRGTYRARLGYVPGANQRVLAGILICFLVSKATYMLRLFVNFLRKFY